MAKAAAIVAITEKQVKGCTFYNVWVTVDCKRARNLVMQEQAGFSKVFRDFVSTVERQNDLPASGLFTCVNFSIDEVFRVVKFDKGAYERKVHCSNTKRHIYGKTERLLHYNTTATLTRHRCIYLSSYPAAISVVNLLCTPSETFATHCNFQTDFSNIFPVINNF